MNTIKLGEKAKDKVTGFEGIVIGKSQWLTGCDQVCLKPNVDKDGKMQDASWFDHGTIIKTGDGLHAEEVKSKKPGGPRSDQPKA